MTFCINFVGACVHGCLPSTVYRVYRGNFDALLFYHCVMMYERSLCGLNWSYFINVQYHKSIIYLDRIDSVCSMTTQGILYWLIIDCIVLCRSVLYYHVLYYALIERAWATFLINVWNRLFERVMKIWEALLYYIHNSHK